MEFYPKVPLETGQAEVRDRRTLNTEACAVISKVGDRRGGAAGGCHTNPSGGVSIGVREAGLNTASEAALDLIVGVYWAIVGAIEVALNCPCGRWTVLHTCLRGIVGMVGGVGCTILDTSVVDGIFEGLDGLRGTDYLWQAILEAQVFVESSA